MGKEGKVVGAEMKDVVCLFFWDFVWQVILAGVFALPLGYLIMDRWLQDYAYRTNISIGSLLGILAGVLGLVLFTVARQIFHVANINPAVEIKRE